ncbi:acyltransferase [Ruminococcus flavefaciens]|uniref:acyltransferase family protein n=1 Tax=Ruminococcus flavefaciens TaxID=1265 RepID=UPI00156712D0|nr:acyltransferase [Ruminococcus flavefaciens]
MNSNNKLSNRKSNFELLRIIAMLLIIMGHISGQAFDSTRITESGKIFVTIMGSGSRIAVNLFLMIGIWFMVDAEFRVEQILKLYGGLWFYSVSITLILICFGFDIGTKDIISCFFPYLRCWMWFVPLYISLLLLSPFLKKAFDHLNKGALRLLLGLGFFLICVVSTVSKFMDTKLCALLWFIYMYYTIGYYKKFVAGEIKKTKRFLLFGVLIYSILIISGIICSRLSGEIFNYGRRIVSQYLSDYKSIPNFMCALCIFVFFSKLDIGSSSIINGISKNTLDVYMIHQQTPFYPILWTVVCRSHSWQSSKYFCFVFLGVTIAVYIVFSLIGRIRVRFIEPFWVKSKLFDKISTLIKKAYGSILST